MKQCSNLVGLSQLRLDQRAQPRAALNFFTVDEYAEAMRDGAQFPPITVFHDGTDYWVADGFHRVKAAEQIGLTDIAADVRQGTLRDAILFSVGANALHGMRRTNADKRRAVMTLLQDDEWAQWPQTKIAAACAVTQQYVSQLAAQLPSYNSCKIVERAGTVYTMNTANIGERLAPEDRDWLRQAPLSDAVVATASKSPEGVTKARQVVEAAETEPETFGDLPAMMDESGSVDRAFREFRRRTQRAALGVQPFPEGIYRVWYADPPWEYGQVIDKYGPAERHYATMTLDEICALGDDIKKRTAENAVLFLWTTAPKLRDAFAVMDAWGFRYSGAMFVWDKVRHNFGHYNSVRHELLLICVKGSCPPDTAELVDSVQSIERTPEHSEKPEEFRAIIDRLYPHGPRIELFARKKVEGWARWGGEA